ncbi:MAG: iron transporter [Subdoligranulum sp.]|nr:iron transporter [Subdoligranulum sp.]
MKKFLSIVCAGVLAAALTACTAAPAASQSAPASSAASVQAQSAPALADGVYQASFSTDSSMFHANEACDGKGVLTVQNGQMSIYVTLAGKGIVNLFPGTAEDARKPGAEWLQPTLETVHYSDGTTDEANAFLIPVPYLDEEFDVALVGKKGTWYDHKVSVSDPQPLADDTAESEVPADGSYTVEAVLQGGSGKASVQSPARLTVENGAMTATVIWSSKNYDRMIVNGQEYTPTYENELSCFTIPVSALGTPLPVQAETTAMSQPHMIDYTLTFSNPEAVQ